MKDPAKEDGAKRRRYRLIHDLDAYDLAGVFRSRDLDEEILVEGIFRPIDPEAAAKDQEEKNGESAR